MKTLFFDYRRLLVLTVFIIVAGGLAAFFTMAQEEDPKITNRFATIITPFPGASADRVENLVTEKIEDELRELSEIKKIRSFSRTGISVVTVELDDDVYETDGPFSRIRDALSDAESNFPGGVPSPVFDDDRGYAYTMMAALVWDADSAPNVLILKRIAEDLQDTLRDVPGTELVTIHGAPAEEVVVSVDSAIAESLTLDKQSIARAIAAADSKVSAGQFRGGINEYVLEVRGELNTLARLREVPVRRNADGGIVRVGDIARVDRRLASPPDDLVLVGGKPAVIVAARMESDLRVSSWAAAARGALKTFEQDLSGGVALEVVFDQNEYASARFGTLVKNLMIGAALVVVVLFITLGWRSALIVTAAIPLTALTSLIVLNVMGIPIHQMSVIGLMVALGLLVDAAIVMTDAIRRRLVDGLSPRDAVGVSVSRLWLPLLSSTVTTVLAFAPITLMPGGAGEFVGPIAAAVITALTASFLLAITVVAALNGVFLPGGLKTAAEGRNSFWAAGLTLPRLAGAFDAVLGWSLKAPIVSMMAAMVLPLLGIVGATTLPTQFFPEADRKQFHVEMRLPPQSSIERTLQDVRKATDLIQGREDVESVSWFLGNSAPSFYYNMQMNQDGVSNYAEAMVTATRLRGLKEQINAVQRQLSAAFPDSQIVVRQLLQGPPTHAPIELRIYGKDLRVLQGIGEKARALLAQVPEVTHTFAGIPGGEPKLWLNADEDQARQAGLSLVDIARDLDSQLEGTIGGTIVEGTEELPIRVRLDDEQRARFDELASLNILSREAPGGSVDFQATPIRALGDIVLEPEASTLERYQGRRVNIVSGYVQAGQLPSTAIAKFESLWEAAGYTLPPGYRYEFGGDAEARSDAIGNLLSSVTLIVLLMIATVVLTFNSFRLSGVVFFVAFLSMGLGLLCLTLGGFPFGFQPIIALLGLVGVAINAAIIILTGLKRDPRAVAGDVEAIKQGVLETSRHITSTTITTFGGFFPLILSDGGMWPPFATTIAGGVLLSTVVSFFFVPQAFLILTRMRPVASVNAAAAQPAAPA